MHPVFVVRQIFSSSNSSDVVGFPVVLRQLRANSSDWQFRGALYFKPVKSNINTYKYAFTTYFAWSMLITVGEQADGSLADTMARMIIPFAQRVAPGV